MVIDALDAGITPSTQTGGNYVNCEIIHHLEWILGCFNLNKSYKSGFFLASYTSLLFWPPDNNQVKRKMVLGVCKSLAYKKWKQILMAVFPSRNE